MNAETLKQRLEEAGCSESYYSIGDRGNDTFCLEKINGEWQVFYTERGGHSEPEFQSPSEEAACRYLWEKMQTIRHEHLVGLYSDLAEAQSFSRVLSELGIENHLDSIPNPVVSPTLYRVFVHGMGISEAKKHFSTLPIRRWTEIFTKSEI
jgi:hypothetical protein